MVGSGAQSDGDPAGWLAFLVVCVCLVISAFYELIEWWTAVLTGTAAEDFLGTQGHVWDTQSDMAGCLLGSLMNLAFLSRLHDRQMADPAQICRTPS
ncbi:DUF2238 domain-containing protein [Desulfoferula mesophila]|uniref:VanZ-like domain-containing protein n=1 Tax=Desulfoferula mesophila TaxID=3058419 RepID=A0AAU9ECE6_9BACT|nr:hypothetical protein FAK_18190 [Desulfoferula mesophilus]